MSTATTQPGPQPRRRARSRRGPNTALLLGPSVGFLLLWMIVPLALTLYFSLRRYNLLQPTRRGFVGFHQYADLLTSGSFWTSLYNTIVLVVACLVLTVVIGLALALLFDNDLFGRGVARTLAISPFFVMPVVTALIWKNMLMHPVYGLFATLYKALGLKPVDWLAAYPMPSIVAMISWEWIPFALLVLLTGLQSLPNEEIEAASLDGANGWQKFRFITVPHLGQTIYVVIMLESIFFLTKFAEIYATTSGGPGMATTNLPYLIFLESFFQYDIGTASAIAIFAVILANIVAIFLVRFVASNLAEGAKA